MDRQGEGTAWHAPHQLAAAVPQHFALLPSSKLPPSLRTSTVKMPMLPAAVMFRRLSSRNTTSLAFRLISFSASSYTLRSGGAQGIFEGR